MEKSPNYFPNHLVPFQMKYLFGALIEDIKLVLILRDPVKRSISGYFEQCKYVSAESKKQQQYVESKFAEAMSAAVVVMNSCYGPSTGTCSSLDKATKRNSKKIQCFMAEKQKFNISSTVMDCAINALERGLYRDQLQAFLCAGFPARNFLIVPFSKLVKMTFDSIVKLLLSHAAHRGGHGKHWIRVDKLVAQKKSSRRKRNSNPHATARTALPKKNSRSRGRDYPPALKARIADFFREPNARLLALLHKDKFATVPGIDLDDSNPSAPWCY